MPTLGEHVYRRRKQLDKTQEELGKAVGVDRSYISQIEHDKVTDLSPELVRGLARELEEPPQTYLQLVGYLPASIESAEKRPRSPQEVWRELQDSLPILVPEVAHPVSAGPGVPYEPDVWPYYPPPEARRHEYVAVPVRGNCMEPRIPEGARWMGHGATSSRAYCSRRWCCKKQK